MSRVRRVNHQVRDTYRPHAIVTATRSVQPLASLSARVGMGFFLGGTISILDQCISRFIFGHYLFIPHFVSAIVDVLEFLSVLGFAFAFLLLGLLLMLSDKHSRSYKLKSRMVSSVIGWLGMLILLVGLPIMTTQFANNFLIPEFFGTRWQIYNSAWLASTFMAILVLPIGIAMLWLDGTYQIREIFRSKDSHSRYL